MYTKIKNWYVKKVLSQCVMIGCNRCKKPFIIQVHQLDFENGNPYTYCPSCGLEIPLSVGENMLFVSYVDER